MYRRYQATPSGRKSSPAPPVREGGSIPQKQNKAMPHPDTQPASPPETQSFLSRLIPQSLYDSKTGKVLGILSADDLFLVALIILIIDSGKGDEDDSLLIYALLYILISEHIDLPF